MKKIILIASCLLGLYSVQLRATSDLEKTPLEKALGTYSLLDSITETKVLPRSRSLPITVLCVIAAIPVGFMS